VETDQVVLIDDARRAEHSKYVRAYAKPNYRMKAERRADAVADIAALPVRGSYLDVSCGQGDMLNEAAALGFNPVQGTEIVPALIDGERVVRAEVHALPFSDKSFDVVTMFDVIEHLIPGDDELACRELARVARHHVILTANNRPSRNHIGEELHINRRPYECWDELFRTWLSPARVTWIKGGRHYVSEAWRVDQ
jgi:ubiquinone/menaquinone biosynthesis C-methylase UbiE